MASERSKQARDLRQKGDKAYGLRKWKKALDLYIRAAEHDPNEARIAQRIGDLYHRLDQKAEAVEQYKKVARLYGDDGFWAKAIAINKIILEIDPSDVTIQHSLKKLYTAQGSKTRTIPEALAPEIPPPASQGREAISLVGESPAPWTKALERQIRWMG